RFGGHGLPYGPDGAYLHAAYPRRGDLRGDLDRFVEVARRDHVKPGELLLGLRERPVGDGSPAVTHPHGGGGLDRLERLRGHAMAALADRGVVGDAFLVGQLVEPLLVQVNQAQIVHRWLHGFSRRLARWRAACARPRRRAAPRRSRWPRRVCGPPPGPLRSSPALL